jgi:2,3,4,5-tetrahydropyridine-2-carboxylate N-succinyltransferase
METSKLQQIITTAYAQRLWDRTIEEAVRSVIDDMDQGKRRVIEWPVQEKVNVHVWLKQALLLYLREMPCARSGSAPFAFYDKVPLKQDAHSQPVRVVPPAAIRWGAYVAPRCIIMPSFINCGAYVDSGTMVDTWATVGSCAQIGADVHLAGGVGIGGVLEPLQSQPVVIEDGVFVGSRAVIVEGIRVRKEAVIGAGVVLTASTPIIDVRHATEQTYYGEVPPRSVVIPGTRIRTFPAGDYAIPCALIVGERSEQTDRKTSLNTALRQFSVPV